MASGLRAGYGTAQWAVLRALAAADEAGLTSVDLMGLFPGTSPGPRQSRANGVLRTLLERGLAERGERQAVNGMRGSGFPWRVTPAGIRAAARPAPAPAGQQHREQVAAARQQRATALAAARAVGHGPRTPRAGRLIVAVGLKAEGCTLGEIGDVFGVVRETVRIWLAGVELYAVSLCADCRHPGGQHITGKGCRLCAGCPGWDDDRAVPGRWADLMTEHLLAGAAEAIKKKES